MKRERTSNAARAIEIILGVIAVAIGIVIIAYPGLTIATITFLLGLSLFFVGAFRFIWGFAASQISGGARAAAIIIGLIAIAVAILIMAYPLLAAATAVFIVAIGVLIYGVGRIVIGASAGQLSGGIRALLIVTGIAIVILSSVVMIYPGFGLTLLAILLAVAFLIIGFESIAAGIGGVRYVPSVPTSASQDSAM